MTTVHIDHRGADVDLEGERLVVRVEGERKGTLPMKLIERVVISGAARLTSRLVARLAERGVGLVLDRNGREGATTLVCAQADKLLRLSQYPALHDKTARLEISCMLVRMKIERGEYLLAELDASGAGERRLLTEARRRMMEAVALIANAKATSDISILRGREGAAAAAFFPAYASAFAKTLGFTGRNRRPPRDPVNVCLSLGYTLAYAEAQRTAARNGFDPSLGVYHDLSGGRDSLACDLVEPARPGVEKWVYHLFAAGVLRKENFSGRDEGGCNMGKTGRHAFYRSFQEDCAAELRDTLETEASKIAAELRERFCGEAAQALLPAQQVK